MLGGGTYFYDPETDELVGSRTATDCDCYCMEQGGAFRRDWGRTVPRDQCDQFKATDACLDLGQQWIDDSRCVDFSVAQPPVVPSVEELCSQGSVHRAAGCTAVARSLRLVRPDGVETIWVIKDDGRAYARRDRSPTPASCCEGGDQCRASEVVSRDWPERFACAFDEPVCPAD